MVMNTLLIKLKEPSSENISKTKELLEKLKVKIPDIRDLKVKMNSRQSELSYDMVLNVKFDSLESMEACLLKMKGSFKMQLADVLLSYGNMTPSIK
ncbi:Dabb family protein [Peribacillus simplex]|uniref:Dabb family protein n=1 Tax=Peribacillus simplex TaxID=1478 RepID=UPI0024C1529D|nr:Dabb family protein [Peribacillus simplex]WHY58563.1 Dabb family protein [Peribacillus simplex]